MNKFSDVLNHDLDTTINYIHFNRIGDNELYAIGCELSEFDGEHIFNFIRNKLHNKIIVSTCAVTESCKKACEDLVEMLHYLYSGEKEIIITGCGVNYDRTFFKKYGKTLDNFNKFNEESYGLEEYDRFSHSSSESCSAAQIKIQDGCDHQCTYCIIPKLKGRSYSIDYGRIKSWISEYTSRGVYDIKLLGTEVCSYSSDGMNFIGLVKRILSDFPMINNLSFNALDPSDKQIFDLIELIRQDKRISNKVELSVQSASDKILKKMNRRHTVDTLKKICECSKDDVFYKWHLIVGFPGESDCDFNETIENIKTLKPYSIAINPYSDRKGSFAEKMTDKISENTIKERCKKVHDVLVSYTFNDKIHTLFEEEYYQLTEKVKFTKQYDDSRIFDITSPSDVDDMMTYISITGKKSIFINYDSITDFSKFEIYTRFLMDKFDVSFTCLIGVDESLVERLNSCDVDLRNIILNKNVLFRFLIGNHTTKKDVISLMKFLNKNKIYSNVNLVDDIRKSGRVDLIEYFS